MHYLFQELILFLLMKSFYNMASVGILKVWSYGTVHKILGTKEMNIPKKFAFMWIILLDPF